MEDKNMGSSFEDFLKEQGTYERTTQVAQKRVLAFQIEQEMKRQNIKKSEMAKQMKTSRSVLGRLLDPDYVALNLSTVEKAASVLGKKIRIELV